MNIIRIDSPSQIYTYLITKTGGAYIEARTFHQKRVEAVKEVFFSISKKSYQPKSKMKIFNLYSMETRKHLKVGPPQTKKKKFKCLSHYIKTAPQIYQKHETNLTSTCLIFC